jgi:hypothetical protein
MARVIFLNLVGSIYGMSFMKIAHAILVSHWSISKKSSPFETA